VHFGHVSTGAALDLIRAAKAEGLRVTCDTAPPYFDLNETAIGDYRTYAKLSPPLRREEDRLAVVAALADGTIDAIASDHQPRDADDKRLPFAQAEAGGAGPRDPARHHPRAGAWRGPEAAGRAGLLTRSPRSCSASNPAGWPRARRPTSASSGSIAAGR
jgi:hypothetical protein